MTPEELTAAAAHSRDAMSAIRHIAQHGGVGGMTYVMTSAEDVPGLLEHIAELERKLATANDAVELMYQVRDRMAADIHALRNPTSGDASVSIEMVGTVTVARPLTGRCGICLKGVHKPVGEDWRHYAMPVPYHPVDGVTVNEPKPAAESCPDGGNCCGGGACRE